MRLAPAARRASRPALLLWLPRLSRERRCRLAAAPGRDIARHRRGTARDRSGRQRRMALRSRRSAARPQRLTSSSGRSGTRATRRLPRAPQPRSGAILVLSLAKDDPGFADENQTLGINLVLIAFPARAMAGAAGAILPGRKYAFFITDLLAMNEVPDRSIAHPDGPVRPVRRPAPRKVMSGPPAIRCRSHARCSPIRTRGRWPPSFPAPRCPPRESAATISRRSKRHPQRRRNRADRLARRHPRNRAIAKIQGIRLGHPCWPPIQSQP